MPKQDNYDFFYDVMDEACMLLYEHTNANYLDCLIRASLDLIEGINDNRLDKEALNKLDAIYEKLNEHNFSSEDIRLAFNLLLVKAFKHAKYPLDYIIPDSISLVFANIIRTYFNKETYINMLELNAKAAVLSNTIVNFLDFEVGCFAIEEDAKMANVAKINFNLQQRDIVVYNNKAIDPCEVNCDVVIGELKSRLQDDKYVPYYEITSKMRNLEEDGIFIFLIDNDFFNHTDMNAFRNRFTGTLLGLLILPQTLFKGTIEKSILIGAKKQIDDFDMLVLNLPNFADAVSLNEALIKIEDWIRDVRLAVLEK